MKLTEVSIENFRSIERQKISIDPFTCFVGPNGSGKSNVLAALNIFFRNTQSSPTNVVILCEEDFHKKNILAPVKITVTFSDLSDAEQEEFKAYFRQGSLIVSATAVWNPVDRTAEVKQYGARLVMEQFSPYFKALENDAKAPELKSVYATILKSFPQLPAASTKDAMTTALREFEEKNLELCVLKDSETQFYGWTKGSNRLEKYVQWVYVPAVKDAATEQQEERRSALGILLERTIRSKINFDESLKDLKTELAKKYGDILDRENAALTGISESLQLRLQNWTHTGTSLKLNWHYDDAKSIMVNPPFAKVAVGEDSFIGEISRLGHGLQRAFLLSLLQELAHTNPETEGPKLILGFEEPELFQHPPQARHVAKVLEELTHGTSQVLITTHSPLFISSKGFENVRMFKKGISGSTTVTQTTYEKVAKILADALCKDPIHPASMMAKIEQIMQPTQNEMYFTGLPVFVEGTEDIAFISSYLVAANKWSEFRRLGCHFIIGGGKTNLSRLVAIALSLQMPFYLVFDSDGDNKDKKIQNERDNKCLLTLIGKPDESPFPISNNHLENCTIWATKMGEEAAKSYGKQEWATALDQVKREKNFLQDVTDKNVLLISGTVEKLHGNGRDCKILARTSDDILKGAKAAASR